MNEEALEIGFRYYDGEMEKYWFDAQKVCAAQGSNIAVIYDEKTYKIVCKYMEYGWIGLIRNLPNQYFQTPYGSYAPAFSPPWSPNENFKHMDQNCVQKNNDHFEMQECDNGRKPYVCQFDATKGKFGLKLFQDSSKHLFKRVCPSVGSLVR